MLPVRVESAQIVTTSTGLLGEQVRLELNQINNVTGPRIERLRQDVLGFDENIPKIFNTIRANPEFGIFDFLPKDELYKIDIGPIQPQMEYELFDDLQVSADVPFAALNLDRLKIIGIKGRYLSDKRYFKIYHAKDAPAAPAALLNEWSQDYHNATPYTLIMKVLLRGNEGEPMSPNDNVSYADVIYVFDDGLYIKLSKEQSLERKIERTIDVLRTHFRAFRLAPPIMSSISGSFIVDRILINPLLFRSLLVQPHQLGGSRPLLYHSFLWTVERDKALALRAQFILTFKLGDIRAKIIISEKRAKSNNIFYIGGSPVKFKEGTLYNQITISDVKSYDHAYLIRDVVASVFFLYGFPELNNDAQGQQMVSSRSMAWATAFNTLLNFRFAAESFQGSTFGPSLRISTTDIKAIGKNIMQLRSCDPTFYGKIAAAKPLSKNERQPVCVVSTSDPNWAHVLYSTLLEIEKDPPTARRQVIRYPFTISNPPSEEYARIPVTKVAPYFLMGRTGAPFFKPKITADPRGGDGTYHPFLISCSTTEQIQIPIVPNKDGALAKYQVLANLNLPLQVTLIEKDKSGRAEYKLSTVKILSVGVRGQLPVQLSRVLRYVLLEGIQALPTLEIEFERHGTPRSLDSLLHVLAANSKAHPNLMREYTTALPDKRQAIIDRLRVQVANSVNWNLARQELFDMEPEQAQALFLDPSTPVDSSLFKSVLESYFGVFICVIQFEKTESRVEIPRHRYFHISRDYPPTVQPLLIFKHKGSEALRVSNAQYELVTMMLRRSPNEPFMQMEFEFAILKRLFDQSNQTLDTSFVTARRTNENVFQTGTVIKTGASLKPSVLTIFKPDNLLFQYIDGAGKLRAVVHRYKSDLFPSGDVTIMCEPLLPIGLDCFDDPTVAQDLARKGLDPNRFLQAEDFDKALEFVQSLGIKLDDLAYRLEPENLQFVQDVLPEEPEEDLSQAEKETRDGETEGEEVLPGGALAGGEVGLGGASVEGAVLTNAEKQIDIMEQLMSKLPKPIGPGAQFVTPLPAARPEPSPLPAPSKKVAKRLRRVVKRDDSEPLAIGIWFKKGGVQFYIATEPGTPPTKIFAIDNTAFFDIDPEIILFRQHDYYEKIANIMIQLIRNLYLYSMIDDPRAFTDYMVVINSDVVYDIRGARRRIPATRNFADALTGYAALYPSFFSKLVTPEIPDGILKLVVESETSKKALYQHLKTLQKLKEDIVGSSGSLFRVAEGKEFEDGVRRVAYQIAPSFSGTPQPLPATTGLNAQAIELIPRMKEFMNRPDYLLEFYIYPSDFQVRGPNQHVFMSEDEFRQYYDLLEMEAPSRVITLPLDEKVQTFKAPLYLVGRDGSVYIFQNVLGGEARRARHVVLGWETDRVNLGYFAAEWDGPVNDVPILKARDLPSLDPHLHFALVNYDNGIYAALLKLAGSILA
jgi:hypothetical protein